MPGRSRNLPVYGPAQAPAHMIHAGNITFAYRGSSGRALNGVSFKLGRSEFLCLAGKNGSGKSSLLALLAGIYKPGSGTLKITLTGTGKARVGLIPQDPDTYILGALVEEDLLLALPPGDNEARERALALARRFELDALLKEPVQTLSYGQKKKLSLASALAAAPDILLMDEPFAGLDYPSAVVMREALAENKRLGLTQVVCEHELDLTADLADSFLLLNSGRGIAFGQAADVFPKMLENGVRPPCWWFSGNNEPLWQQKG